MPNKKGQGMAIAIVGSIFLVALAFVVFGIIFYFDGTKIEKSVTGLNLPEQQSKLFYNLMNEDVEFQGDLIKFSDLVRISMRTNDFKLMTDTINKKFSGFSWYFAPNYDERELNSFNNFKNKDVLSYHEFVLADERDIQIKFLVENE